MDPNQMMMMALAQNMQSGMQTPPGGAAMAQNAPMAAPADGSTGIPSSIAATQHPSMGNAMPKPQDMYGALMQPPPMTPPPAPLY